jgi:hypothetical protein
MAKTGTKVQLASEVVVIMIRPLSINTEQERTAEYATKRATEIAAKRLN